MKVLNDIQYELNEIAGISEIIDVDDNGGVDIPRGDDAIETFINATGSVWLTRGNIIC